MEAWFTTQGDLWLHLHVKDIRRTLSFYAHTTSKIETNNPLSSKLVQCPNSTSNNNNGKMSWHLKTYHSINIYIYSTIFFCTLKFVHHHLSQRSLTKTVGLLHDLCDPCVVWLVRTMMGFGIVFNAQPIGL